MRKIIVGYVFISNVAIADSFSQYFYTEEHSANIRLDCAEVLPRELRGCKIIHDENEQVLLDDLVSRVKEDDKKVDYMIIRKMLRDMLTKIENDFAAQKRSSECEFLKMVRVDLNKLIAIEDQEFSGAFREFMNKYKKIYFVRRTLKIPIPDLKHQEDGSYFAQKSTNNESKFLLDRTQKSFVIQFDKRNIINHMAVESPVSKKNVYDCK